jgi:D-proline reductase (dithiol) PrdB
MIDGFKFLPPGLPERLQQMKFMEHDDVPWSPLNKKIEECKFAILSTAGISVKGDRPFDMERERREPTWGDPSFRVIPKDAGQEDLEVNHLHVNTRDIEKDVNCAFPLARFRELEAEGKIGSFARNNYSIMGYIPTPHAKTLVKETAPAIASQMKDEGVDAVFMAPV